MQACPYLLKRGIINKMDISRKILSDPINKWFFSQSKNEIYLVGGYVRDLLRGRVSRDKDFVIRGDAEEIARQAARKFNGRFILLKEDLTCRIVLKDKSIIDINYLNEPIEDDLRRRDFTLNAIAWSPDTGILDPCNGIDDIGRKSIRVVDPENLKDDPLRVIRAYRLSAGLGFKITPETRKDLKRYSRRLKAVASERITGEMTKLLNQTDAGSYLRICNNDNVLGEILPIDLNTIKKNINLVSRFDTLSKTLRREKRYLDEELSHGLKRAGLIRMAILLLDGPDMANHGSLKLSRANIKALKNIHNSLKDITGRINDRRLYLILKLADPNAIESMIIFSLLKKKDVNECIERTNNFLNIKRKPLLKGDKIEDILKIGPGRRIGRVLSLIEEERFLGNIRNMRDAKRYVTTHKK